jgi:hypothetical protein
MGEERFLHREVERHVCHQPQPWVSDGEKAWVPGTDDGDTGQGKEAFHLGSLPGT